MYLIVNQSNFDPVLSPEINREDAYSMPFQTTKSTKLREFQYKLLHRRLATNTFLFYNVEDDTCTFCKTHKEDLSHLFWTCEKTTNFWKKLKLWLISYKAVLEDYDLLGLRPDKTKCKKQINFCLQNARYYIYGSAELQTINLLFNNFCTNIKHFIV